MLLHSNPGGVKVAMVSGYLLWLADIFLCAQLREVRRSIGLPWAWILELHGW